MTRMILCWAAKNWVWGWLLCLPFVLVLVGWALDRDPPFAPRGHFVVRDAAQALREMDEAMESGWLRLAVHIPASSAPGPSALVTQLHYICNPLHEWAPIVVHLSIPFEIKGAL